MLNFFSLVVFDRSLTYSLAFFFVLQKWTRFCRNKYRFDKRLLQLQVKVQYFGCIWFDPSKRFNHFKPSHHSIPSWWLELPESNGSSQLSKMVGRFGRVKSNVPFITDRNDMNSKLWPVISFDHKCADKTILSSWRQKYLMVSKKTKELYLKVHCSKTIGSYKKHFL